MDSDSLSVKRRLTCILAADAVGYSSQIGHDEEGTIRVLSAHRAVIDGIIAFHQGRIISTAGDSVLAEFTSVVEAVRCAVEMQEALKTRNDSLPEKRRMLFRVGVNLGDVVVKNDDLLGDGVNVAARLESIAEPGGICISSSVYDQITGKLDLGFQDIGNQNLKNISRPIHAYRVSGSAPPVLPRSPERSANMRWLGLATAVVAIVAAGAWQMGWLHVGSPEGERPVPVVAAANTEANRVQAAAVADAARIRAEAETLKREAEAERARARADGDAMRTNKIKSDAETAAARVRSQAEADATRIRADAARPATKADSVQKAGNVPVVAAPVAAAVAAPSAVAPQAKADPVPPPATGNNAFDGTWDVTVTCAAASDGAAGYQIDFVAQVKDGQMRGTRGADDGSDSLRLEGEIRPDGNAALEVRGRTGDPKYAVNRVQKGTAYGYPITAHFEGGRGTGRRVKLRPCDLNFVRR